MNFEVLTLFPHSLEPIFGASILGRASAKGVISVNCTDIRDYTKDKHRKVDDAPYGGGYGMVMMCQPVVDCIRAVKSRLEGTTRVIYMSPQGSLFNQKKAEELTKYDNLILLCGHYEGIDERIIELEVDEELSVGDYVLTEADCKSLQKFDDAIAACNYDIDIHNPEGTGTSHYYFKDGDFYTIPYRSLIPKGICNMLVAGRCISSDHGAQASYRIMPTVCTIGEAAGTAIAIASKDGVTTREVDIRKLQKTLTDNGAYIG
jgi:tRNA G37 N-methylase TrmD